jgi:hypothetical protein
MDGTEILNEWDQSQYRGHKFEGQREERANHAHENI